MAKKSIKVDHNYKYDCSDVYNPYDTILKMAYTNITHCGYVQRASTKILHRIFWIKIVNYYAILFIQWYFF